MGCIPALARPWSSGVSWVSMPIITSSKTQPEYDVAIVGSGAGGGQMAFTLTLGGLKCVMLEAGRNYDPATETPSPVAAGAAPPTHSRW